MVGSGHVVKLGDFGMTRAMFDSDYYRFGRKGKLLQFSFCFNTITVTFVTFGQNYPHKSLFMIFKFFNLMINVSLVTLVIVTFVPCRRHVACSLDGARVPCRRCFYSQVGRVELGGDSLGTCNVWQLSLPGHVQWGAS